MMKVYGPAGYKVIQVTDAVSWTVQESQAHFEDFTHNISMAIGSWSSAGQSLEELAGAAGLLTDRGAAAGRIGFWLRGVMDAMIKPSKQAAEAINQIGLQVYDASGKMLPFSNILAQVKEKTKDMTKEQRDNLLVTIWGTRAGSAMRLMVGATTEQIEKYSNMAEKAKGLGLMYRSFDDDIEKYSIFQAILPLYEDEHTSASLFFIYKLKLEDEDDC